MLIHIALPEDWSAAQAAGTYTVSSRGVTLAEEGYIHCSFAEQTAATAKRFYGDLDAVHLVREGAVDVALFGQGGAPGAVGELAGPLGGGPVVDE